MKITLSLIESSFAYVLASLFQPVPCEVNGWKNSFVMVRLLIAPMAASEAL